MINTIQVTVTQKADFLWEGHSFAPFIFTTTIIDFGLSNETKSVTSFALEFLRDRIGKAIGYERKQLRDSCIGGHLEFTVTSAEPIEKGFCSSDVIQGLCRLILAASVEANEELQPLLKTVGFSLKATIGPALTLTEDQHEQLGR